MADIKNELDFGAVLSAWSPSAIQEGTLHKTEKQGEKGTRYADLLCLDKTGQPLMAVEYIGGARTDEALEFWPPPYRRWEPMRELPLEKLRMLLLAARANPAALDLPGAEKPE